MKLSNLVDLAKGTAKFVRYQDSNLWYVVEEFVFPIPISDAGGGEFLPEMKGLHLLRWMRKHHEFLSDVIAQETR